MGFSLQRGQRAKKRASIFGVFTLSCTFLLHLIRSRVLPCVATVGCRPLSMSFDHCGGQRSGLRARPLRIQRPPLLRIRKPPLQRRTHGTAYTRMCAAETAEASCTARSTCAAAPNVRPVRLATQRKAMNSFADALFTRLPDGIGASDHLVSEGAVWSRLCYRVLRPCQVPRRWPHRGNHRAWQSERNNRRRPCRQAPQGSVL